MRQQLEEDIYEGQQGCNESSDIENIEGDIIAQMLDVTERSKR